MTVLRVLGPLGLSPMGWTWELWGWVWGWWGNLLALDLPHLRRFGPLRAVFEGLIARGLHSLVIWSASGRLDAGAVIKSQCSEQVTGR